MSNDQPMDQTLLLLLHAQPDGTVDRPSLETVTATLAVRDRLRASLHVGLVGSRARDVAAALAACGASRWLAVEGEAFDAARYATDAAAAEALVRASGASVVVAPHTSRWARALPGVACRLGGRVDTHVTRVVVGGDTARRGHHDVGGPSAPGLQVARWYYRQRIEAVLTRAERPWIILVDPGCHAPWPGGTAAVSAPEVHALAVEVPPHLQRTRIVGIEAPTSGSSTIRPDADLLFVAGAGWTKKQADGQVHLAEAEQIILEFLELSQASLGGSKSLVDLSGEGQAVLPFLTHLHQVGQTGSTPRHRKGLSTCCHGEEPHVVGWRFITERRAINLDPGCGWARGKADVLYVADAFEVMRRLNEHLRRRRPASTPA